MEDWKITRKECRKFGKKLSDKTKKQLVIVIYITYKPIHSGKTKNTLRRATCVHVVYMRELRPFASMAHSLITRSQVWITSDRQAFHVWTHHVVETVP